MNWSVLAKIVQAATNIVDMTQLLGGGLFIITGCIVKGLTIIYGTMSVANDFCTLNYMWQQIANHYQG